jgi:hypothetical protein
MRYTWAQFRSYLRLARKRRAEDRKLEFLATNLAMAGGESAKAFLQAMNRDIAAAASDTD